MKLRFLTLTLALTLLFGINANASESKDSEAPVKIAIIDTGISTERLDEARISEGRNYVSDTDGDLVGHGTRIASLIIGAQNGELSIPDSAPNAELVPLTYYSKYPSGVPINGGVETIVRAIYDAVDEFSAKVILISSGVYESTEELETAVLYAEDKGVTVVSAVGNDGDERLMYPAAYETVIGVGSVDPEGVRSDFSQRSAALTLVAPGEELRAVSIRSGRFFEAVSGTSFAAAYVAAASAVLLEAEPELTPSELRELLTSTASDLGDEGYDLETGHGLLNLEAALDALTPSKAAPVSCGVVRGLGTTAARLAQLG